MKLAFDFTAIRCPSCNGMFYHYAGCTEAGHGVVISNDDRMKWAKERNVVPQYDVLVAAQVIANQI